MATRAASEHRDGRPDAVPQTDSDAQFAQLRAALAVRLAAVCRDWDPTAFDALIERMARTKLRWAEREAVTDGRRGPARETPRHAQASAPKHETGGERDA